MTRGDAGTGLPDSNRLRILHPIFQWFGLDETSASDRRRLLLVVCSLLLAVFGSLSLWPLWHRMIRIWMTDPLRVIGAAFPAISLLGIVMAWRRLGWKLEGSFWGLVPLALSIQLSRFVNVMPYFKVTQAQYWWEAHPGPVVFLYGVGAVLLFGGWRLLRQAILPVFLLLCVNPVPQYFNFYFDMPLQQLSASTARAFAHLIGLHPTGVQLRMMFSPDFGMMIVPGCNGVRGSVTLGYLALIYGYSRRLRPGVLAAVGAGALLCGYAMNLLRLCVLVIYYRIGLSVTSIQSYGAEVDYAIGVTIFLLGTGGLGYVIRSLPQAGEDRPDCSTKLTSQDEAARHWKLPALRFLCFVGLTLVPIVRSRGMLLSPFAPPVTEEQVRQSMPATVGGYKLLRTFSEQQYTVGGAPMVILGEYVGAPDAAGVSSHIILGLYVSTSYHRLIESRLLQGIHPKETGSLDAVSSSIPIHLGTSFYDEGESREFDAETNCTQTACANPMLDYQRFRPSDYLGDTSGKHLPILLRMEWSDADPTPTPKLRAEFEEQTKKFVASLDIPRMVNVVGNPMD